MNTASVRTLLRLLRTHTVVTVAAELIQCNQPDQSGALLVLHLTTSNNGLTRQDSAKATTAHTRKHYPFPLTLPYPFPSPED